MKNLIPYLFFLFFSACGEQGDTTLNKCWTLAERGEDFQLFYPCGDARLPHSRFRLTYTFYANDSCKYSVLSPNDAHYYKAGLYEYISKTSILTINGKEGDLVAGFERRLFESKGFTWFVKSFKFKLL